MTPQSHVSSIALKDSCNEAFLPLGVALPLQLFKEPLAQRVGEKLNRLLPILDKEDKVFVCFRSVDEENIQYTILCSSLPDMRGIQGRVASKETGDHKEQMTSALKELSAVLTKLPELNIFIMDCRSFDIPGIEGIRLTRSPRR